MSRCLAKVKECAESLNKENLNKENLNKVNLEHKKLLFKMQFDLSLGFALMSIEDKDRPAFIKSVEESLGKKISLSEEDIIKRSVATHMVVTKYNLQYKENNSQLKSGKNMPLNETEKKVKGYLNYVDISNLDNAVDQLLEKAEFKQYYAMHKDLYIDKFDATSGELSYLNMEINAELHKGYQDVYWIIHPELKPKEKIEEIPLKKVNKKTTKKTINKAINKATNKATKKK